MHGRYSFTLSLASLGFIIRAHGRRALLRRWIKVFSWRLNVPLAFCLYSRPEVRNERDDLITQQQEFVVDIVNSGDASAYEVHAKCS